MPISRHKTVQAVAGTIRLWSLIPDGSRVLVALSGGPDSVALAAILRELSGPGRCAASRRVGGSGPDEIGDRFTHAVSSRTAPPRFLLALAHLNHGLRATALRDEQFVRQLADRWALPLVVELADVAAEARRRHIGLEEAARAVRYEFLERAALKAGAALVALGHHSDDQAETVLMSFLRGAGVRGLAGMPIRRPMRPESAVSLIRPLLEVGREQLLDYLRARRLEWMEDETNLSPEMMRNRVRLELLPLLESRYSPGLRRRLAQAAQQMAAVQQLLSARAAGAWDGAVAALSAGSVSFHLEALRAEGRAVTGELLLAALERLGAGRQAVSSEHLSAAWDLVSSQAGGRTVELPGGARLARRGRMVRLSAGPAARRR